MPHMIGTKVKASCKNTIDTFCPRVDRMPRDGGFGARDKVEMLVLVQDMNAA